MLVNKTLNRKRNLLKVIKSIVKKIFKGGVKPEPQKSEEPRRYNKKREPYKTAKQIPRKGVQKPHIHKTAVPRKSHSAWDLTEFKIEEAEGKKRFHDFDLPVEIMRAVFDLGFKYCTPIQAQILDAALKGKDAAGQSQTGTGKTAAFLIAIYSRLLRKPVKEKRVPGSIRSMILAPTRELAFQIEKDARSLSKYLNLTILSIVGGMGMGRQIETLKTKPIDLLIATPGRLIDLNEKGFVRLDKTEILVIDEADRMLDMGFIPDVKKIVYKTPHKSKRQTLFFSATLNSTVRRLASSWTTMAEFYEIEPEQVEAETVEQIMYLVSSEQKYPIIYNMFAKKIISKAIVFCNRKDEAAKLVEALYRNGIDAEILSGDIAQKARLRTLENFKTNVIKALVATDLAGRGLHIDDISHVINYNLPEDPEDYVHRIGRTGRAGKSGVSISFADESESFNIPGIEKFIGHKFTYNEVTEDLLTPPPPFIREYMNKPQLVDKEKYKKTSQVNAKKRPPARRLGGDRRKSPGKKFN